MKPLTVPQPKSSPSDDDFANQTHLGHTVPSQDPNPAAQIPLKPLEAKRESQYRLMGGGVVASVAAGAALGVMIAGPVGVVIGATIGAIVGTLAIGAAGATTHR